MGYGNGGWIGGRGGSSTKDLEIGMGGWYGVRSSMLNIIGKKGQGGRHLVQCV